MAEACSFPESDAVLDKPNGMTYEDCSALSILRVQTADGMPAVVSCWKLTAEELAEINRTGRVWLMIYGVTMPPSVVCGEKPFTVQESR